MVLSTLTEGRGTGHGRKHGRGVRDRETEEPAAHFSGARPGRWPARRGMTVLVWRLAEATLLGRCPSAPWSSRPTPWGSRAYPWSACAGFCGRGHPRSRAGTSLRGDTLYVLGSVVAESVIRNSDGDDAFVLSAGWAPGSPPRSAPCGCRSRSTPCTRWAGSGRRAGRAPV